MTELRGCQVLPQLSESLYTHRPSSDTSTFLEFFAHKTYTTKARRSDILQATGEASSEANQLAASSQETERESHSYAELHLEGNYKPGS